MTEEEKEKIINAFNNAWNKKIASENSYGKLASKQTFENKEEIINKDELKKLRFLLQSGQKLAISTKEFERVFDKIDSLEQENKELKNHNNHLQVIIDDGRAENKRFREENKELKKEKQAIKTYLGIESKNILKRLEELDEWKHDDKLLLWKYRSALEEIRILATKNVSIENFVKIQNKINEVLNDK